MNEIENTIMKSKFGKVVNIEVADLDIDSKVRLCTSLALLIHVAKADRNVCSQEISYIKRFLKKSFSLSQDRYRNLVKYFNYIYTNEKPSSLFLSACKKYLKTVFNEKEKELYIETLLALSCSDRDMSKIEISFIKNISISMDLDRKDILQKIISKSLILMQELDAELLADTSLRTDDEELATNKIQFASAYEFLEN